ncbi:MAG: SDR family oxidoreductase [Planctomycetota bacterium]
MDFGLHGKVAAVAASTSGLGLAVATELALEGAHVFIGSRGESQPVEETVRAIRARLPEGARNEVAGVKCDFSDPAQAEAFVAAATERFGRVDVLVANNGGPAPGPAEGVDVSTWEAGFRQTFLSSQRLAEVAIAGMKERSWGRILFITSTSVKQPIAGLAVSTAMRSAVVGYAKTLSDELAPFGITVNTVAPGSILTPRLESLLTKRANDASTSFEDAKDALEATIPTSRVGSPEEFAAAVTFLASSRASYITGTVLQVDGGLVRSLT